MNRLDIRKAEKSNESVRAALRDAYAIIESETFKLLQNETEFNIFPSSMCLPFFARALLVSTSASRLDTFRRLKAIDVEETQNGGIPKEAWEWETHDENFRADLISEFVHLDSIFLNKVKIAKSEYTALEMTL